MGKCLSLENQQFGRWTVIDKNTKQKDKKHSYWNCICSCGNSGIVREDQLVKGISKSCGCLRSELSAVRCEQVGLNNKMKRYNDLTNKRFNNLIAIEPTDERKDGCIIWKCLCDCGRYCYKPSYDLTCNRVISCGLCNSSKGENKIKQILVSLNINFIQQYRFQDCRNKKPLPFDFYLPNYNCCIEYDGEQHFINRTNGYFKNTLKDIQFRDNIKTLYCKDNNIKLIRIPYIEYNKLNEGYLKERILNE